MKPKPEDALGSGIQFDHTKPKGTYYVQFSHEPLYAAIAAHDDEPFHTIEECKDFVTEAEQEVGTTFNVVDIDGKIYKSFIVTHEGAEEIRAP